MRRVRACLRGGSSGDFARGDHFYALPGDSFRSAPGPAAGPSCGTDLRLRQFLYRLPAWSPPAAPGRRCLYSPPCSSGTHADCAPGAENRKTAVAGGGLQRKEFRMFRVLAVGGDFPAVRQERGLPFLAECRRTACRLWGGPPWLRRSGGGSVFPGLGSLS